MDFNNPLKTKKILDDTKRHLISFLKITQKMDSESSEDIDKFIKSLDQEGLNDNILNEAKKLSLILDTKLNTKFINLRESKNNMERILSRLQNKNLSQPQIDLLTKLKEGIKNGLPEHEFLNLVTNGFTEFSNDVEFHRDNSKKIVTDTHDHFKEGTQDIVAADVGRAAKTITRDVLKMAIQLHQAYPTDQLVQELHNEIQIIAKKQGIQFFAVTDILSRLSARATQLQQQDKIKSQEYLHDINSKLKEVFEKLSISANALNESQNLTNEFNGALQKGLNDFRKSTIGITDINELRRVVENNVGAIEKQVETYTKKQELIQRRQKHEIDNLEINLQKALKTQHQLEKTLSKEREASTIDELTQIPNRRSYIDYITQAHSIWSKQKDGALSLVVFDIDKFKTINDQFGHQIGDAALKRVSEIIKKSLKDAVFFARYGGEEFVLVVPANKNLSLKLAEKIRLELLKNKFGVGKRENLQYIHITCSFGVAEFSDEYNQVSQVFEMADTALYQAKNDGRNCVVLNNNGKFINFTKMFKP